MDWIKRFRRLVQDTGKHISEKRSEKEIWAKSGNTIRSLAQDVGEEVFDRSKQLSRRAELVSSSLGERLIRAGEEVEQWFQRKKDLPETVPPSNISATSANKTETDSNADRYNVFFDHKRDGEHPSDKQAKSGRESKEDSSTPSNKSRNTENPRLNHLDSLKESGPEDGGFYEKAKRFADRSWTYYDKPSDERSERRAYGFEDRDGDGDEIIDDAELDESSEREDE